MPPNASYEDDQVRLTLWPRSALPEMPVTVQPLELRDGWLVSTDDYPYERDLPYEFVLRQLRDADLRDQAAVADLIGRNGMVRSPFELDHADYLRAPARKRRPAGAVSHVEEAAAYLGAARALVNHWAAHTHGREVAPAWQAERFDVKTPRQAWDHFSYCLNAGIAHYRTRVEVEIRMPWSHGVGDDGLIVLHDLHLSIYDALCLQVFNMVQSGVPPRECANDKCGHLFVQQEGRALHGQHRRAGVLYCSRSCANAQAQRDRRAAKRQESTGVKRGES